MESTRGEFAPPSLRLCPGDFIPGGTAGTTRGEFAPPSLRLTYATQGNVAQSDYEGRIRPSLIAAPLLPRPPGHHPGLRGANSPLPHCGDIDAYKGGDAYAPTRGEFAPPSLRRLVVLGHHVGAGGYEGRIRPSLIAAFEAESRPGVKIPTRGEFAPPSLRLVDIQGGGQGFYTTRGEFAPPSLRLPPGGINRLPC